MAILALGFVLIAGTGSNAMRSALCIVLLVGLFSAPIFASSDEYLELSNIEERIDEYGLAVFSGQLHNTHTMRAVGRIWVHIVLKKDGRIIGIEKFTPYDAWEKLDPLATISFEQETLYAPEDYDEFSMRVQGKLHELDRSLVVGNVYLVEESFNAIGNIVYGEICNDTNAIIDNIYIEITLLDARGDEIITLKSGDLSHIRFVEVQAGQTVDFSLSFNRIVPFDKAKSKEVKLRWDLVDIVLSQPIATTVESTSWGQIKQTGKE